jgi:hypothetical protein
VSEISGIGGLQSVVSISLVSAAQIRGDGMMSASGAIELSQIAAITGLAAISGSGDITLVGVGNLTESIAIGELEAVGYISISSTSHIISSLASRRGGPFRRHPLLRPVRLDDFPFSIFEIRKNKENGNS